MKQNQSGFSLVELLIVVMIIGILSALAVPNLLATRRAANEASAVSGVRTIVAAEQTYHAAVSNNTRYGLMPDLKAVILTDEALSAAMSPTRPKSGYYYTINLAGTTPATADFVISANPSIPATAGFTATGTRRFCASTEAIIRGDTAGETIVATVDGCLQIESVRH